MPAASKATPASGFAPQRNALNWKLQSFQSSHTLLNSRGLPSALVSTSLVAWPTCATCCLCAAAACVAAALAA
eukprot:2766939-Amphidinium_carterae.1